MKDRQAMTSPVFTSEPLTFMGSILNGRNSSRRAYRCTHQGKHFKITTERSLDNSKVHIVRVSEVPDWDQSPVRGVMFETTQDAVREAIKQVENMCKSHA
jgi:hypothetical protein